MSNQFCQLAFVCVSMSMLTACGGSSTENAQQAPESYSPLEGRENTVSTLAGAGVYRSDDETPSLVKLVSISGTRDNRVGESNLTIDGEGYNFLSDGFEDDLGGYEYVATANLESLSGKHFTYLGTVGIVTSSNDVPTQGTASYSGEANVLVYDFLAPSANQFSTYDVDAAVNADFAAGTVDTLLTGGDNPYVNEITVSGMTISGNSFSGGTFQTSFDGVVYNFTGNDTTLASEGHFYGYDITNQIPDEVGGTIFADGDDGRIIAVYRAD